MIDEKIQLTASRAEGPTEQETRVLGRRRFAQ